MNKSIQGLDPTKAKEILYNLIKGLVEYHPLPWAQDHDWTAEVINAHQRTVLKTGTDEEAKEIANLANSFIVKLKKKKGISRKKEFEQLEKDDLEHQREFGERAK